MTGRTSPPRSFLAAALEAVRESCALAVCIQRTLSSADVLRKPDDSPVTAADFAVQALIARALARATPELPLVGEESIAELLAPGVAQVLEGVRRATRAHFPEDPLQWIARGEGRPGPRFWTLDPVDGTKGFLRGGQFALALALIEQGRAVLGVLGCPALDGGTVLWAVEGEGAFQSGLEGGAQRRIQVAPNVARWAESVEPGHADLEIHRKVAAKLGLTGAPLRLDSQVKYAAVARGDAAFYLRIPKSRGAPRREKIWDHAAGAVVLSEAGGRVTDLDGKPLDFGRGSELTGNVGIAASNAVTHEALLEALQE